MDHNFQKIVKIPAVASGTNFLSVLSCDAILGLVSAPLYIRAPRAADHGTEVFAGARTVELRDSRERRHLFLHLVF